MPKGYPGISPEAKARRRGYVKLWRKANPEKVRAWGRRAAARRREKFPEKCRQYTRDWLAKHPEKSQEYWRRTGRRRMLAKYGLTPEGFEAILLAQARSCSICGSNPLSGLQVDHDHVTGAIRGLICGRCNKMLGLAKEDPRVLQSALGYVLRAVRKETLRGRL